MHFSYHYHFYFSIKTVGATVLGGLTRKSGRGILLKQTCAAQNFNSLPLKSKL